jgi:hypothetical protein
MVLLILSLNAFVFYMKIRVSGILLNKKALNKSSAKIEFYKIALIVTCQIMITIAT